MLTDERNKVMLMVNMTKDNYAAWNIDYSEFSNDWSDPEKLKFFARYAVLAPSGHNTQPWQLSVDEESLTVSINPSHHLSSDGSGLLSVEPYISIGTYLEVFSMAARGFGCEVKIRLFPASKKVAIINISNQISPQPGLIDAIVTRVSNRKPFKATPIVASKLKQITDHGFSGVTTNIVTSNADISFVAEQTKVAIASIMSKPKYRRELSAWVRPNHTRKYDGMPGFTHGFGLIKSLFAKQTVRHMPSNGPGAEHSAELIKNSGALIIVSILDNNKNSFINAGRLYSQICVTATRLGLASSALGASVIDQGTREKVKQHFKIKDRPVYIIRLGVPIASAEHSPRWPIERIMTSQYKSD